MDGLLRRLAVGAGIGILALVALLSIPGGGRIQAGSAVAIEGPGTAADSGSSQAFGDGSAVAPSTQTGETRTIRVVPGFNFLGWTGPPISPEEAFAPIQDKIGSVFVWFRFDGRPEFHIYRPAGPAFLNDLQFMPPGDGYWLFSIASEAFDWEAPATTSRNGVVLVGRGALNLVTWLGADGTAVQDAIALFDEFIIMQAWDPARERFVSYAAALPAALNTLTTLNYGDAFWIQVDGTPPQWSHLLE